MMSSTTSEALWTSSMPTAKSTASSAVPPQASQESVVIAGRTRLPPESAT